MRTTSKVLSVFALVMVTITFAAVGRTEVGNHLGRVSIYRWPVYFEQPPVEVVEMKLGNQRITPGVSFSTSDDWLRNLSVTVRNVSQKNLKLIRLRIEFPRDAKGNSTLPDVNFTGGQMFHFSPQFARMGEDLTLYPAKTFDLKVSQEGCDALPADSKRLVATFTTISVDMVLFDDNTGWMSGTPVVRDRDNRSLWVPEKGWDAALTANLKRFAGLRSFRSFAHHVDDDDGSGCYRFKNGTTGPCGSEGSGCTQTVYNLESSADGFKKKSRSVWCSCGFYSSTNDTDNGQTCGLAD